MASFYTKRVSKAIPRLITGAHFAGSPLPFERAVPSPAPSTPTAKNIKCQRTVKENTTMIYIVKYRKQTAEHVRRRARQRNKDDKSVKSENRPEWRLVKGMVRWFL